MHEDTLQPDARKNLVGQECPMNAVYAKLELAKLVEGQVLELILAEGPAVDNVTLTLAREGHMLLGKRRLPEGNWSLLSKKAARLQRG